MRIFWSEAVKRLIDFIINKEGSSLVMLAIIFTGFAVCIAGAIGVSRSLVVNSECEMFGRLWTKAILSEYDVHLLDDYSIMAYFGHDDEVTSKLDSYLNYSAGGRLGVHIKGANAELTGFELGDPANFRRALRLGFAENAVSEIISGRGRTYRDLDTGEGFDEEGWVIRNPVVIDTLPSHGTGGSVSGDELTEKARSAGDENGLAGLLSGAGAEVLLLEKCFDNHVTKSDDKDHLLVNEWEYVIRGSTDDEDNYRTVRRILFAARNALNLISLYRDPSKVEVIVSIAETITPGPLGLVTQAVIAEAWAALETEEDLEDLYHDRRVPVLKTPGQWKTDLGSVLGSESVKEKLDEETRELLDEKRDEVLDLSGNISTVTRFSEGLNYDEYLLIMITALRDDVRLLRIMDLIQINMKYRYYADFNMMEYFTGVRFTIEADRKTHEFEDAYK